MALDRDPHPAADRTRRPQEGARRRGHAAGGAELLRRTAARPRPRRTLRTRRGVGPVPRQYRRGGRLRRLGRLQGAERALRQPRRRRGPGRAGRTRPGEPGAGRPRGRPDRGGPADRDPEQAGVTALPAGERTGRDRGRRQGQLRDGPRQRQVPAGPVPPVDERRGPQPGDRRVRREDRPRPDRRQPGARRAWHRLAAARATPRRTDEGRLRRLGRPGVQAGRPTELRVLRLASRRGARPAEGVGPPRTHVFRKAPS